MTLRVRLKNLDTKDVLFYPESRVEVTICKDGDYTVVGTCLVYEDELKRHFGELKLNSDISDDLYFYYRARQNDAGIYMFAGIDLMENEQPNLSTVQLSEVLIF